MTKSVGKEFARLFDQIEADEGYWVERAKVTFAAELWRELQASDMTKADLARKIGKSAAYVSKVFSGETNFTLASMVGLASSVNARVHIHLAREACDVKWFDVHSRPIVAPAFKSDTLVRSEIQVDMSLADLPRNDITPSSLSTQGANGIDDQRVA